ncbi:MAG: hypothetical protein ACRED0_00540 [Gammaproteobacteria bacterium]
MRDSFQVHGFLSQAYILTSNNDFFGNSRSGGSLDFRELGINASVRPMNKLQLSAQLLSRRAGGTDDGAVRIDYGFADYTLISTANVVAGVRAGRITNPLGFYNETRDAAFTRNGILLPQSIYFDRTRNLALSADGGGIYGEWRSPIGDFYLRGNIAFPRAGSESVESALLGRQFPGELEGDASGLGQLLYEGAGGKLRLAVSGGQVNIDYDEGGIGDPLNAGPLTFEPIIFSAQYNTERFSLTAEYAQRSFRLEGIFPNDIDTTGESYYLQASYQLGERWEVMVRFDSLVSDRDDRDGEAFQAATGRPAFTRFAEDWTVGLRWDVTRQFMLRAEYHHVDGTAWLPSEDSPNLGSLAPHWDIFAVLASFRF